MKVLLILGALVVVLVIGLQLYWLSNMAKIERHGYDLLKKDAGIELRTYDPAVFISSTRRGNIFKAQGKAFMTLASYIFGENETSEKIAMTAPVHMEQKGDSATMRFMIPSKYTLEDLPAKREQPIEFVEEPGYDALAIRYGGYNNEAKFERYRTRLQEYIATNGYKPIGDYFFLGYNHPAQWIGRRNEVLVKVEWPSKKQPKR